jgi:hypothetical protein
VAFSAVAFSAFSAADFSVPADAAGLSAPEHATTTAPAHNPVKTMFFIAISDQPRGPLSRVMVRGVKIRKGFKNGETLSVN